MNKYRSFFIIGTDTEVGKTLITALLAKKYQKNGVKAAPFKPIASGATFINERKTWADIAFLSKATGVSEEDISCYKFNQPLSPHLAAKLDNKKIGNQKILDKYDDLSEKNEAVLVEGIGGALVPLNEKKTLLDLAATLNLPVIIVARPNLGTLNHTLLTIEACKNKNVHVAGIILNRYPKNPNEAEKTNPHELEKISSIPVIGLVPEIEDLSVENIKMGEIDKYLDSINLAKAALKQEDYTSAIKADLKHVWHPFTPMQEYVDEKPSPLMIVKAEDSFLYDSDGNRYIDGVSSLWVNVHGHRNKELNTSIKDQLNKVSHSTLLGLANEPSALLAKILTRIAPAGLNKVFYSDSGSTAVEIGLKVAFQYFKQTGKPEKKEFISFKNAYHGDTIGAVSVGGMEIFHSIFKPMLFKAHHVNAAYCYRCPAQNIDADARHPDKCNLACLNEFEKTISEIHDKTAAVILEPKVQGAAGILVQPDGYIKKVADLCKECNVLLLVDEVATGFGRTGSMFACEHEEVVPDIMALAKGISGGYLPLAATLFQEKIYEAFLGKYEELKTFFHGHTYTGNPLACAAAIKNLELFETGSVIEESNQKAKILKELLEPLKNHRHVGDIRQCSLMVGIELVKDKETKECFDEKERVGRKVILRAREKGIIIRPLGDVIVLMPPLSISENELIKLVDATAKSIDEITAEIK